ncbi:hypothetical protein LUZ60_003016 [Juncus effusus]|nr:hypothetical protein LUZ60_003016 [Juncus effusus]
MISKSVFVYVFLLFLALRNVTVRGRDLSNSKQSHNVQGAGYYVNGRFHGVRARINVWAIPDVQPQSLSVAYIAATNQGQMIATGVHVYPDLYKDNNVHIFTYWSNGTSHCYNTQCNFEVASATNTYPGQGLALPLSTYGGEQRFLTLRIKKDEQTGDWSLYREDQGGPIGGMTLLGWWPKTSLGGLSDAATHIVWRGEVSYQFNERSPSMGSGHYPNEFEGRAACFQNILGFWADGRRYDPEDYDTVSYVDKPGCYDVSSWFNGKHNGYHFFYGGPGGCSDK